MTIARLARCLVILMICLAATVTVRANADTPPQVMVRAHLEPSGSVVAGTQVKLVVECLTTTWFTDAPEWPLFDVPGAFVTLPDESAENLDETIDGVKWFGVSRAYRITPQAARRYDIPSFAITLHPGGVATPVQVKTPALSLTATVPPGAEGMAVYFPAPQLDVSQTVTPRGAHVRVGDVITRTITQRAAATESMLIPPIVPAEVAGLKRNAAQAATKNIVDDRAGLVAGERTDTVSYVVERAGSYRLPEITVEWWNSKAQRREKAVLPAVSISAVAAREKPLFGIPADTFGKGGAHRVIFINGVTVAWAVACLAGILLAVWAWPLLVQKGRAGLRAGLAAAGRYRRGEGAAWRALLRVARSGTRAEIVPALYRWLDRRPDLPQPACVTDLRDRCGAAASSEVIASVNRGYGPAEKDASAEAGAKIAAKQLRALRHAAALKSRAARKAERARLAPLNHD